MEETARKTTFETIFEIVKQHFNPKSPLSIILDRKWDIIEKDYNDKPNVITTANKVVSSTGVCGVNNTVNGSFRVFYNKRRGKTIYGGTHKKMCDAVASREALQRRYGTTPNSNTEEWECNDFWRSKCGYMCCDD